MSLLQIPYILVQSVIFTVLVYAMVRLCLSWAFCSFAMGAIEMLLRYFLAVCLIHNRHLLLLFWGQIRFEWTAAKFFWFLFFEILSLTLFTMYGIASVALTPNVVVASIVSGESALPNQWLIPV